MKTVQNWCCGGPCPTKLMNDVEMQVMEIMEARKNRALD
jgi:hypothetical protein